MSNSSWIDILPPPLPTEAVSWWGWLFFVAIMMVLSVVIYRWHHSAKQTALRELKSIRRMLLENKDIKQIPFKINQVLKRGFQVNNINSIKVNNQPQWLEYTQQLTQHCFSKNSPNSDSLEALLSDTHYWIKNQSAKYRSNKNG